MLSFVIRDKSKIEICCDAEGASALMQTLAELTKEGRSHRHLRTPPRGGTHLSETDPFGHDAVHEVIINYSDEGEGRPT